MNRVEGGRRRLRGAADQSDGEAADDWGEQVEEESKAQAKHTPKSKYADLLAQID